MHPNEDEYVLEVTVRIRKDNNYQEALSFEQRLQVKAEDFFAVAAILGQFQAVANEIKGNQS